jgi:hypothetical protein
VEKGGYKDTEYLEKSMDPELKFIQNKLKTLDKLTSIDQIVMDRKLAEELKE